MLVYWSVHPLKCLTTEAVEIQLGFICKMIQMALFLVRGSFTPKTGPLGISLVSEVQNCYHASPNYLPEATLNGTLLENGT